jgi:hypothetical protein
MIAGIVMIVTHVTRGVATGYIGYQRSVAKEL